MRLFSWSTQSSSPPFQPTGADRKRLEKIAISQHCSSLAQRPMRSPFTAIIALLLAWNSVLASAGGATPCEHEKGNAHWATAGGHDAEHTDCDQPVEEEPSQQCDLDCIDLELGHAKPMDIQSSPRLANAPPELVGTLPTFPPKASSRTLAPQLAELRTSHFGARAFSRTVKSQR